MQLVKYRPHQTMTGLSNNSSRLFGTILDDFFTPLTHPDLAKNFLEDRNLKVDIYEKDNTLVIEAELPGIEKEDLFVDVKGKSLKLGGDRKNESRSKDEHCYRREMKYGKFERTFNLPFEINSEKVTATFNNGILRLEVSKPEEEKTSKITVQ